MSAFLDSLQGLSAAEEFLDFLDVPFEPDVVRVNRLHILKRFHDYVADLPSDLDDASLKSAYAQALERAYADFVLSSPGKEKVFKVFQRAGGSFVPLSGLTRKS